MPRKREKTKFPGVTYREHPTRKHGVRPDRYFSIRFQKDGERHEEGLGWASNGMTAELANETISELKRAARTGNGERTLKERRAEKKRAQQAETARLKREISVSQLVVEYIERHAKRNKKSWAEDQRALQRDIIPAIGDFLVKDVTRTDAANLLEQIVQRGAPVQACNVLEKARKMFNLAVKWGYCDKNPFSGQERPAPRPERDRVLSDQEIFVLWEALDPANTGPRGISMSAEMRRAFRLILATGQRPGEVIGLHRQEIEDRWWTIPKERSKNGKPHRVYLTDLALEQLGSNDEYIFPSPKGRGHIAENALALSLRRNILGAKDGRKVKGISGRKKHEAEKKLRNPPPANRIGIQFFRPHDLRRTVLTGLARLRVPYEVRERIVNHSLGKLENTYNWYDYDDEKISAMKKWEAHLRTAITGKREVAKVVNLHPK